MHAHEAKKLRCCGPEDCGRIEVTEVEFGNGMGRTVSKQVHIRYCVGSDCMAWRYRTANVDSGFCGLAGRDSYLG